MMKALADGFDEFISGYFRQNKNLFEHLSTYGQAPKIMMISCADSRVDPAMMFNSAPGDVFIIRNVANLVPPYQPDTDHHSVSSALEFAVKGLKVEHIIIMGHAQCGGIEALYSFCEQTEDEQKNEAETDKRPFIKNWVNIARPAIKQVDLNQPEAEKLRQLEQASIVNSLANLRSFAFVKDKEMSGGLGLHGWWFDMKQGRLWHYREDSKQFVPLAPAR